MAVLSLSPSHARDAQAHGDHVLDEVTVAGGVNDSDLVLGGLELPERDVDRDTALTLGLELVKNPGVLERALAELSRLLLELLDRTLVDTAALVDEVAGGGRLAAVDVSDDDDVDVKLVLGVSGHEEEWWEWLKVVEVEGGEGCGDRGGGGGRGKI